MFYLSMIGIQEIDCNCNNCKHLSRDFDRRKVSVATHFKWQLDEFFRLRIRLLNRSLGELERNPSDKNKRKYKQVCKQVSAMKWQFQDDCAIHYGVCGKLNKDVSFIPNTCQLETQKCFDLR